MNIKYFGAIIFILSMFVSTNILNAQVKNSVYSMFGVGEIIDNSFGIPKSLGGTGIAFQSGRSINFLNPASYLGIHPNSFSIELGAYGVYTKSANNNTHQTNGDINFSYLSAGFYGTKWWASTLGIIPFSSIDYEIHSSDEIGGVPVSVKKIFTGTGGLSRLYAGNSFNIHKGLSIGFNASFIFGPITQTETAADTDGITGYEIKSKRTVFDSYFDYGLQYSIRHNNWVYTLGLIYGADKTLNSTDEFVFSYNENGIPLEQDKQSNITIPQKFGIGVSVKKGNSFRVGLDYEWKNWSQVEYSHPGLDIKNSNRFSIGGEYSPIQTYGWLSSLLYRFGVHYNDSHIELNNTRIRSMGISFGVGIPYDINLSIEYGSEGTLQKGLVKNNYLLFYVSISLREKILSAAPRSD